MLSIILVNFRSLSLIKDCIHSIGSFDSNPFEIIIIDNSNDDPTQLLEAFPFVQWIPMGYNAGFARANNKGIQMANGEIVLLLNPDIIIKDNAIHECYSRFNSSSFIACGVQLLNVDGSPQISGSYFMKGGLNHLLPIPFLGNFFKWLGNQVGVKKTSVEQVSGTREVDWINGAFLMVKKEIIQKAGLMDEDFFLYAEEIEWCSRLKKHGKLAIYGDLHAIHLQGETANESFASEGKGYYNLYDSKGRQLLLSNFVRIRKQFGTGWFLVHLFFYLLAIPVFFIGLLIQSLLSSKKQYSFKQFRGYCSNMIYLLGKSMTILRNQPYFYKVFRDQ